MAERLRARGGSRRSRTSRCRSRSPSASPTPGRRRRRVARAGRQPRAVRRQAAGPRPLRRPPRRDARRCSDALVDDRAGEQLEAALLLAETLDLRDVADRPPLRDRRPLRRADRATSWACAPDADRARARGRRAARHRQARHLRRGPAQARRARAGRVGGDPRATREIGARILEHANLRDIATWVLAHHERLDGRGYPHGLPGEQHPPRGRILAVADAYEAMTADRLYRDALPRPSARAELRRDSGAAVRRSSWSTRSCACSTRSLAFRGPGELAVVPAERPTRRRTAARPACAACAARDVRVDAAAVARGRARCRPPRRPRARGGSRTSDLIITPRSSSYVVAGLDLQRAARLALEVAHLLGLRVRPRPALAVAHHVPERHQVRPAVAADVAQVSVRSLVEEREHLLVASSRSRARRLLTSRGRSGPRRRPAPPRGRRRARARRRRPPP